MFLILLLAGFTFLQALHIHGKAGHTEAAQCTLCAATHAPAALTLPAPLPELACFQRQLILSDPMTCNRTRITALFSRPPPSFSELRKHLVPKKLERSTQVEALGLGR